MESSSPNQRTEDEKEYETEYERFSSYVRRMSSSRNDKFYVKLCIEGSVDLPSYLYKTHFLSVQDLPTKSSALRLSKLRRDTKYNTVFCFTDRLFKCQIVNRRPRCIFKGLSEVFVTDQLKEWCLKITE